MGIEQYVARHLAPATFVLHEIESDTLHVDVHVVPPAADRSFWFVFTTGMSALPMNVPPNMGLIPHAELCMALPDWWCLDRARWEREPKWFWPIRELTTTARYPHKRRTWLGAGHTLVSADPPRPFDPSTKLTATLLLPCSLDESHDVAFDAEVPTELLEIWPLHTDELEFKLAYGTCALLDRLSDAGVSAVLDPMRPSSVDNS